MGDFNYSQIDLSTLEGNSRKDAAFVDCIMDSLLTQHVQEPLHDKNILDLVFTSDPGMVEDLQVVEHLGNSDHNSLIWKLICNSTVTLNKQLIKQFHKGDYVSMRRWFDDVNWEQEHSALDFNEMWLKFTDIINQDITMFVLRTVNKYPNWMHGKAKRYRKYKSQMWSRYREYRSYNDLIAYRRAQNKAVKEYRKAKKKFE